MIRKWNYIIWLVCLGCGFWSLLHADETHNETQTITQIVDGQIVHKKIIKRFQKNTDVNFEASQIDGKVKKPNAAYLLHNTDLNFDPLYTIELQQIENVLSSYEYIK